MPIKPIAMHLMETASLRNVIGMGSGLLVLAGVSLAASDVEARPERHDRRQTAQIKRIQAGVESGEITSAERARLVLSGQKIRRVERRAEADGEISVAEARRLEHLQDKRSRQIYRMKHDNDK